MSAAPHFGGKGLRALPNLLFATFLTGMALAQSSLTNAQIAKRVSPSVVLIQGKTDSAEVVGSGFIISRDGKIVTNLHVIRDIKTATVQLANGEIFDSVSVLATDERRDLAIIHIAAYDTTAVDLGNSNSVAVGEPVVVVGSPLGLEGTVTAGILSAVRDSGDGFKVLQTDAAVNPGNSGGPLINGKGQAIGVVSFKLRSSVGLNFAVPINYVNGMLNELHQPLSLDEMRATLAAMTSTNRPNSGPPLNETLHWLEEKLPLGAGHYVVDSLIRDAGRTKEVSQTTKPIRFDSCDITFETAEQSVWEKLPGLFAVSTFRFTVPLGDISAVSVKKDNIPISNSKALDTWVVMLTADSKTILVQKTDEGVDKMSGGSFDKTTKTESSYSAVLVFYDESIANRVSEAFKRAAVLCRGKDPFRLPR